MQLAPFIDHTVLKNTTSKADVAQVCREAIDYGFAAVCVPPYFVEHAKKQLNGTAIKVASVAGFPFGYQTPLVKLFDAEKIISDGADELDFVMNISAFKSGDEGNWISEIQDITWMISNCKRPVTLKVIIESGILSDEEIIRCCNLYQRYPIQFLKTSTGFGGEGASVRAVQLMRKHLPDHIQIKASGGIRDYAFAKELIDAGATRLGCSASVAIVKGEQGDGGY